MGMKHTRVGGSRQIFEHRFPVPADAVWNAVFRAYVWKDRIPAKHPYDDLWLGWQEAWKAAQQVPEGYALVNIEKLADALFGYDLLNEDGGVMTHDDCAEIVEYMISASQEQEQEQ